MSFSNHEVFGAKSATDCLRFGKFRPQICESCGATYRRNYTKHLVQYRVHVGQQKAKTSPKLINNSRRYPSSIEIDQNMRFWIWRSAVALSDAKEKNRNTSAHTISFDNQRNYIASCGKKNYIQMHIYVVRPNLLRCNFFQSLNYRDEVWRTNFSPDFWTFWNFWPQL